MKVTRHARMKLLRERGKIIDEDQATDRMLRWAGEEILDLYGKALEEAPPENPGLVKRIIDNDFEETRYYRKGRWRMVVVGDTIVTMERNRFINCGPKLKPRKGGRRDGRRLHCGKGRGSEKDAGDGN